MKILLKKARLFDPESGKARVTDILVSNGKIERIDKSISVKCQTFYAGQRYVIPGMIDLHTHLREPGREDVETIASGTRAAAKGGFTTVCSMANTKPAIDSVSGVKYIIATNATEGKVRVLPVGAVTKELKGKELTEIGKMHKAGSIAISDDGTTVMNSMIMRRAMEYCKMFDLPLFSHPEDLNLTREGMMNEGKTSTILGLRGMPAQAEEIIVSRDISLAELTGCRLHLCHITTKRSVDMIREAKKRGIAVTAEVTPHHLTFTEEDVIGYDTNFKMKPPLRTQEDIKALINGLKDGTIDCIATDHAPHLNVEKNREFALAPFGITGLETAFGALYTFLVDKKSISFSDLVASLTVKPASILKQENLGKIEKGSPADITVIDTEKEIQITEDFFISKSKNSPYLGKKLKGLPVLTLAEGKIAYKNESVFN